MGEPVYLTGRRTKVALESMLPPFPDPSYPEQEPFDSIPVPAHISSEIWQASYYDATSAAPMGIYVQRPSGPCDLVTGKFKGQEWETPGPWHQV